ncbi:MAG TPA: TRAP transporter fused permease subunit [Burkholderiales bacterium]|nr:TRAP transporter fused permease subunit [Burkholderiales bacterium]
MPWLRRALGFAWFAAQMTIAFSPQIPMLERTLHVMVAMLLVFLWLPRQRWLDALLVAAAAATTVYYALNFRYLTERMENVDPVLPVDQVFGLLTLILLLEAVRRVLGWNLFAVVMVFIVYGFTAHWMPGWLHFHGFGFAEFIEIMTMTGHGIFGITTETSVNIVFYFLAFSAVYLVAGGTELFMDVALKLVGKRPGGAAKAEVVSSALFGTVSGSAVANVTVTGSFTIPLMMRTGYSREEAAAHEAIASTGGQLMPPVMGIAAFVMADILGIPYARIALAAVIPAVTYYAALYLLVHLKARRHGKGSLPAAEIDAIASVIRRLHLLLPPIALLTAFFMDYSASTAAIVGTVVAWACSFLPGGKPITFSRIFEMTDECAKQACQVAVPIAAIGIIIGVAIQSNLAIKFSTQLLALSGGTMAGSLFFVTLGILILGMGLPTVAAYVIAAILFVPALTGLGFQLLAAHMFVLFFSVLSMVTPPVALASYTAAGIANANASRTGTLAFILGMPAYVIPFAFLFTPSILWQGTVLEIALGAASVAGGSAAWTIMLAGWMRGNIGVVERAAYGVMTFLLILAPGGSGTRAGALVVFAALLAWSAFVRPALVQRRSPA